MHRLVAVQGRRTDSRVVGVVDRSVDFDEAVNDAVFGTSPYDKHTGRETRNEDDSIFDPSGLVTIRRTASGYLGVINVGVNASAA